MFSIFVELIIHCYHWYGVNLILTTTEPVDINLVNIWLVLSVALFKNLQIIACILVLPLLAIKLVVNPTRINSEPRDNADDNFILQRQ